MSMLARYKKGGNIIELVKLIEDAAEPKRTQLMNMVRGEDPAFAAQVEARIFDFEKLKALPENIIAEVISVAAPKFVAMALVGEAPEFVTLCEKCLGKNFGDYKAEKESIAATPPNENQIAAARRKLIAEARKLEASGSIKLITPETEAAISSAQAQAASPAAAPGAPGAGATPVPGQTGTATATEACPVVESFGIEAPPPGLNGERFETFLKSLLGK